MPGLTSRPPAAGIDVLVIDDSELMRRAIVRVLQQAGLSVVALSDPSEAARFVQRRAVRLVLVDLEMPGVRGDRLMTVLRQQSHSASLRIVLMSGEDAGMLHSIATATGADASLPKSEGASGIRRVVERFLLPRRTTRPPR